MLPDGFSGAAFLQAPGSTNDHDLGLFEIGAAAAASPAGRGAVGLYHLAWEVDTLADLERIAQALADAGGLVGASDHGTTKSLYGKDPDGLEFEVVWLIPADLLDDAALAARDPHRAARPREGEGPLRRGHPRRHRHLPGRRLGLTGPSRQRQNVRSFRRTGNLPLRDLMRLMGRMRAIALLLVVVAATGCSGSGKSAAPPGPPSVATTARSSAGCSATAAAPGRATLPFTASGRPGTYVREVPPAYTGRTPLPLVLDLHGYAESADLQSRLSALGTLGAKENFVTVTPQLTAPVPNWIPDLDGADVRWIGALLDSLEQNLCLDQRRVYVTGYSNGAIITSSLMCAFADRIAAAAPVAGLRDIPGCRPSRPVPVLAFHGTADAYVPYDGRPSTAAAHLPAPDGSGGTLGQTLDQAGGARVPGADITRTVIEGGSAMPDILAAWARREGCPGGPASSRIGSDVTLLRYSCPPDAAVSLYRVEGGGHAWPGSRGSAAIAGAVGRTTFTIDADALMWDFFREHPLPG